MSETTELKEAIENLEKVQQRSVSLLWNLYRGIFYSIGFFVGGTLLVALAAYLLSLFDTAPIVGEYISKIMNIVSTTK